MTTLEQLQALTDEQLIEKAATAVMGWEERDAFQGCGCKEWHDVNRIGSNGNFSHVSNKTHGCMECADGLPVFSPLTDWNHTMEVVKAIIKDQLRKREFLHWLQAMSSPEIKFRLSVVDSYVYANQRDICNAALLAVSN